MRNEARAPLAESPERKARSSRRQIPQLRVVPPPPRPGEEFDDLDWASLEETTKKLDKDRTERKAAEAEALAREQAEFKERREDARILREVDEEEREAVKTRLRGAMDKMRAKHRTEMDRQSDNRDESVKKSAIPKQTNPEFFHEQKVILNFDLEKNRERFAKKPKNAQEELEDLQTKLNEANEKEGRLQENINDIKSQRGTFARLGRWLSKITGGVAETPQEAKLRNLETELEETRAKQHDFLEEIQLMTYRSGLKTAEGRTRKATMVPESLTKIEANRSIDREEARERFNDNRGMSEADAEAAYGLSEQKEEEDPTIEIKEEEVNLSDLAPDPEPEKPKKAYRKIKPEGATGKELMPPKEIADRVAVANKEKSKEMTIAKAIQVLEKQRAADLWDQVEGIVRKDGAAGMEIMHGNPGSKEHPATLYVFELAKAVNAQQDGNMKAFEASTNKLMEWNKSLGYNNAYVNSILAARESNVRGMKNVITRRNRSVASERRFLRP